MKVDNDPTIEQPSVRDTVQDPKKLGLGKQSPNLHENLTSLRQEREWVDVLLDCSRPQEEFEAVVNCLSWEEACIGWRRTLPNVTYISRAPESNSKKDAEKEKEKENSKHRNSQKLISFESDLKWKNCVEPGTYRYVHKSAYAGIPKKRTFNKGPVKRPVDAHLQEHIRKVKEHLEKVLVNQAEPRSNQRPLGSVYNHGDYVANLIRDAKPYRHQPYAHVDSNSSPRLSNLVEEQSQTKVPDVGLTYTVKRSTSPPTHKSPLPHHPPSHPENKVQTDLVSALGSKLNDLIQQDNFKHRIVTTKPSKGKTDEKPRASYEKFTVPAQVESPALKPLIKVTPGQRKIQDDNDFISAVAKMNKHSTAQSEASQVSHYTSPSPSKENQYITHRQSNGMRGEDMRLQRLDPANKNFFTSGISGKAVSPSDIDVHVHMRVQKNLAGMNPVKVKKRGTLYPQKVGPLPVANRGDQGFHVATRLADPLHRGVVDREVASAIASELLPGVNGHKIRFPLQQTYRIV